MESSVLFRSSDGAIVVIDIPRSLEEAQVLPGQSVPRRIVSTQPVETPWQVPESKKKDTANNNASHSAAIAELMTLERVTAALETVRTNHGGPWGLPRVTRARVSRSESTNLESPATNPDGDGDADTTSSRPKRKRKSPARAEDGDTTLSEKPFIPEESHHILGSIESQREVFLRDSPLSVFDLIVLDPPWPSRSDTTVYNIEEARNLLNQIPVASQLKRNGLVAIWITNKSAIQDLLTAPGGVFAQWGLEPIGEWIWVKITTAGEPVLDVHSAWRKPWERLLIARVKGSNTLIPSTKVILGVPDVHSRKPNLRGLFEDILPAGYLGLEVFARNLTAGWWSWGNEVLFFQQPHHWVAIEEEKGEEEESGVSR
ncbi:MT-A70-domain-containing protein [Xylaria sp. CBS 124048]|nr:MT-A70-domain-containing protein [Xylaria sp. CBS 124048]